MSKVIIPNSASNVDIILEYKFNPLYEAPGKPVYIDVEKKIVKGVNKVNNAVVYAPVYGEQGITSYQQIWINRDDLLRIADTIKAIEAKEAEGIEPDDLPF